MGFSIVSEIRQLNSKTCQLGLFGLSFFTKNVHLTKVAHSKGLELTTIPAQKQLGGSNGLTVISTGHFQSRKLQSEVL